MGARGLWWAGARRTRPAANGLDPTIEAAQREAAPRARARARPRTRPLRKHARSVSAIGHPRLHRGAAVARARGGLHSGGGGRGPGRALRWRRAVLCRPRARRVPPRTPRTPPLAAPAPHARAHHGGRRAAAAGRQAWHHAVAERALGRAEAARGGGSWRARRARGQAGEHGGWGGWMLSLVGSGDLAWQTSARMCMACGGGGPSRKRAARPPHGPPREAARRSCARPGSRRRALAPLFAAPSRGRWLRVGAAHNSRGAGGVRGVGVLRGEPRAGQKQLAAVRRSAAARQVLPATWRRRPALQTGLRLVNTYRPARYICLEASLLRPSRKPTAA